MYCGNCGEYGHIYRKCTKPITSYGIILYKKNESNYNYLMIRRRHTLGYVEFIRGKYNLENYKYIFNIFKIMTKDERLKILESDFDILWNDLWMNKNNKQYKSEYMKSKTKFNKLKNGILTQNIIINLKYINDQTDYIYTEPEWGFPKGRRNIREEDLECAIRECHEETGISKDKYLITNKIFSETFLGTNNIKYRHIYYLSEYTSNEEVIFDKSNFTQISEISAVKWLNIDECLEYIRPYNNEKKIMIKDIDDYMIQNNHE